MMGAWALLGTAVALGLWLAASVSLVRQPGPDPRGHHSLPRRLLVAAICVAGGVAGCWGPTVQTSSEVALAEGVEGAPAEEVTQRIRTPVVVASRSVDLTADGERIREVRTRAWQIPVTLLGVLGWAGWWALRRTRHPGAPLLLGSTFGLLTLLGCGGDGIPVERAERVVQKVDWDTLWVFESPAEDTLLFEASRVAADARGIRVLDRIGHRIAFLDWEGRLGWYAGSRGSGPGELANPRALGVDDPGTSWILDVQNLRITGFDPSGRMVDEVALHDLDFVPHEFAPGPGGDRFFLARPDGGIRPVQVRRDGSVGAGRRVRFPESRDAPPLALQGDVRSDPATGRWVVALSMGDGFLRFQDLDLREGFVPWVEPVPLARVEVTEEGGPGSGRFSRTQRIVDPVFAAQGTAIMGSLILVRFGGRSLERGRLLDVYDLDTGAYRGTLLLPVPGWIGAWGGRLVVARNTPHPQVVALEPSAWP